MLLPPSIHQAVILAREWAEQDMSNWTRANASTYATELLVIEAHVPQGYDIHNAISTQILYLLGNLKSWRGPLAKEVKRILNDYQQDLESN